MRAGVALLLLLIATAFTQTGRSLSVQGVNRAEFWAYRQDWATHLDNKLELSLRYADLKGELGLLWFEPSKHSPAVRKPLRLFDYSLAYSPKQLEILFGRFFQTFGKGLALSSYSDDDFRHYKSLHGLRGIFRLPLRSELVLLGGRLRDVFFQENTYKTMNASDTGDQVLGADFETRPLKWAGLGGRYVRINRELDPTAKAFTELFGGSGQASIGPVDVYAEVCQRLGTKPGIGGRENGFGYYVSGTLALAGFSVLGQFMDYDKLGFPTGVYHYNDPPTPIKSGVAINRGVDERGFGLEVSGSPLPALYLEANLGRLYVHDDTSAGVLEWEGKSRYSLGTDWTFEAKFNHMLQKNIELGTEARITDRPTILVNYLLGNHTFAFEAEYGFVVEQPTDTTHGSRWNYHEPLLSMSYGYGEALLFTVGWQGVDKDSLKRYDNAKSWPMFEVVWSITERNVLRVRAGAEKGGYTCSGGVCRYETPFTGAKLQLISRF
uniref:Alginate export domain-containing protein n=1 Tax=candidate division WOR-3 bacterium TaxID=2052148 RepID=A0A7C4G955_UNCW3